MSLTPDEPDLAAPDAQLVELAGHRRVVPDEILIRIERGARVLVFADLRLAKGASDCSKEVMRMVARAIEDCPGPGVVVLAGDAFDLRDDGDVEAALLSQPRLASALTEFTAAANHRLIVLPGTRDRALAFDSRAIDGITAIGGEVALACALEIDTGVGCATRRRWSPAIASIRRPRSPTRGIPTTAPSRCTSRARSAPASRTSRPTSAWLDGIDDLLDSGDAGAFVASRFAYRRLLRRSAWLLVPALVGLALFLSFIELTAQHTTGHPLVRLLRLLRIGLRARARARRRGAHVHRHAAARRARRRRLVGHPARVATTTPRGEAVTLAAAGGVGLITGHTRRAELTDLGGGVVLRELRQRRPGRRAGASRGPGSRRSSWSGCGSRGSSSKRAPSCTPGCGTACATSRTQRWLERIAAA